MQIYNGKRWISYNVNFTMGRDGCLVMKIFLMGIDGSTLLYLTLLSVQVGISHPRWICYNAKLLA